MAQFALLPQIYVPTFEVKVKNQTLEPKLAKSILDISVTQHLDSPGAFNFRLNDPTLELIDKRDGRFQEGNLVEISIGYVGNIRPMIVGTINSLSADFSSSGPATLDVQGFDLTHLLANGTTYQRYGGDDPDNGLSDSEVATQVVKNTNLKISTDSTPRRTKARVQNHISDLAFLQQLADANGYSLWADGETVYFKRPDVVNTILLEWRKTLLSFSPRLSIARQVDTVIVRGWDPDKQEAIQGRAPKTGASSDPLDISSPGKEKIGKGTGGKSELVINNRSISDINEAETLAGKLLSDLQQVFTTGSGTSVGHPDINAGSVLELKGIGRFNGKYLVGRATHSVGSGGYNTSFSVTKRK